MQLKRLSNWGIGPRVALMNLLSLFTVIAVVAWFYGYHLSDIQDDLNIQGQQNAALLANNAEYGVVSGNLGLLKYQVEKILNKHDNIVIIEIFDKDGRQLLSCESPTPQPGPVLSFEEPIVIQNVAFNPYDLEPQHLEPEHEGSSSTTTSNGSVVGRVRLKLSPASMIVKKRTTLMLGAGIGTLFLLINLIIGHIITRSLTQPLMSTVVAIRRMRVENIPVRPASLVGGEIGELQRTLVDMAKSLFKFQQQLEQRVAERTEELRTANKELEKLHADALKLSSERSRLLKQVTTAAEAERRNIAVEIHDHLNASLIVTRLEAQHVLDIADKIEKSAYANCGEVVCPKVLLTETKENVRKILNTTMGLYKMARDIVKRLRPEVIDTLGLVPALEEMVRYYDQMHPDCYFELTTSGALEGLPSDLAISVYRLVQEALSNVVKHAKASVVQVSLKVCEAHNRLKLRITDNGIGFEIQTVEMGIGLIGMRERVSGVDGTLTFESAEGKGTSIVADLPLLRAPQNT